MQLIVRYREVVDFQTFLDPEQIEEVGLRHQDGKLRIVLGASIHKLAGPMIEKALQRLLQRHGLSRCGIRLWVVHPGGLKEINDVQAYLGLTDQ
jgi:predicted naringenin-chalcone synthase